MRRRDLLTSALAAAAGGCASQQIGSGGGELRAARNIDRSISRLADPFSGFVRRETGRW